ncbi:MAG: helix-turn-helix domain-containing protein [Clostridia bacterium]|nr:helix-turn-helix domain-containing protein [Clostridia bacterium]
MTQAELAGDTITRNMLSQIENGVAQPSVTTIMELAEKLGVPTEYFFSENGDLDAFRKIGAIAKIKKLYTAGDYGKCISRLENLGVSDDETEYLFARAAFDKGVELYRAGFLSGASAYFEKALLHAEKTIYTDDSFISAVQKYHCASCFIRSKEKDGPIYECDMKKTDELKADLFYIASIAGQSIPLESDETDGIYAEHLAVRKEMQKEKYDMDAMMKTLRDILSRADETRYAVLKYYVLCDLETLAGRTCDYKCAYECSSARLALAEKMNQ